MSFQFVSFDIQVSIDTFDLHVFCRSHLISMSFVLVSFDIEVSVDIFV